MYVLVAVGPLIILVAAHDTVKLCELITSACSLLYSKPFFRSKQNHLLSVQFVISQRFHCMTECFCSVSLVV